MGPKRESDLRPFFEPRSVAVIGSLREGRGEGYTVIQNLCQFGFTGNVYPINPSYNEVLGMSVYPTVNEVSDLVDLAVIITPPPTIPAIVRQCAQKGIRAAIIASEGFAEASEAGARLQQQLLDTARAGGVRLIGPNTIGIVNTANGLVTNPYAIGYNEIRRGNIAYASQSGVVGAQAQSLEELSYPISKMCDFGNKCDVNEIDLLEYLSNDQDTEVIAIHMEAAKGGQRFMDSLRKTTVRKPVLIFKAGRTEQGAKAAASHTGSVAGRDQIYSGAFKQAGGIEVNTWQEFWDVPKVFAYQPLPKGNRLAIVTPTGGAGVIAIDTAVKSGLAIAELSEVTVEKLAKFPANAARNPVDLGPTLVLTDDRLSVYRTIMSTVLEDPHVDCATMVLYAGTMLPLADTVDMFSLLKQHTSKPMTIWIYGTSLSMREELSRRLETLGLPTYLELETAVRALGLAVHYSRFRSCLSTD